MEVLGPKNTIEKTLETVRTVSFQEKRNQTFDEEKINVLLDQILNLKNILRGKADFISKIAEKLNAITWFNDLDEECLIMVNDIISSAKDLYSSLIRQYISMDFLRRKGIAIDEINSYKESLDDLQESYTDLESVFFFLPEIDGFVDTTKALSLI